MVRLVTSIAEPQPRNVYVLVYNKLIFKLNYTHVYFVCQYVRFECSRMVLWIWGLESAQRCDCYYFRYCMETEPYVTVTSLTLQWMT